VKKHDLKNLIVEWDLSYPLDYLFRKKTGIRFGSKEHKEVSILEIYFFLKEEEVIAKKREEFEERVKEKDLYRITGDIFSPIKEIAPTEEEITHFLDQIDIKKLREAAENGSTKH